MRRRFVLGIVVLVVGVAPVVLASHFDDIERDGAGCAASQSSAQFPMGVGNSVFVVAGHYYYVTGALATSSGAVSDWDLWASATSDFSSTQQIVRFRQVSGSFPSWTFIAPPAAPQYATGQGLIRQIDYDALNFVATVEMNVTNDIYVRLVGNTGNQRGEGCWEENGVPIPDDTLPAAGAYLLKDGTTGASIGFFVNVTEPPGPPAPVERSPLTGETGVLYGGNRTDLAASMRITPDALDAFYGLLFVVLLAAAGFGVFRVLGAAFGALAGVVVSLFLGFFPVWLVAFVAVVMAGAFMLLNRRGGGVGGG